MFTGLCGHWKAIEGFLEITETIGSILNSPGVCMKHEGSQKYSQAQGWDRDQQHQGHTRTGISSPWIPTSDTAKVLKWPQEMHLHLFLCLFLPLAGCGSSAVPVLRELRGEGTQTQCFHCPSPTISSAASGGSCFGELSCGRKAEPLATPTALCFYHSLEWISSLTRVGV